MDASDLLETFVKGVIAGLMPPIGVYIVSAFFAASPATLVAKALFFLLLVVALIVEIKDSQTEFDAQAALGWLPLIAYCMGFVWALTF